MVKKYLFVLISSTNKFAYDKNNSNDNNECTVGTAEEKLGRLICCSQTTGGGYTWCS